MDPCRNTTFCDQGIISPVSKDFERMSGVEINMIWKATALLQQRIVQCKDEKVGCETGIRMTTKSIL